MPAPGRPPAVGPRPGSPPDDERTLANTVRTVFRMVLSIDGVVMSGDKRSMTIDRAVLPIDGRVRSIDRRAMATCAAVSPSDIRPIAVGSGVGSIASEPMPTCSGVMSTCSGVMSVDTGVMSLDSSVVRSDGLSVGSPQKFDVAPGMIESRPVSCGTRAAFGWRSLLTGPYRRSSYAGALQDKLLSRSSTCNSATDVVNGLLMRNLHRAYSELTVVAKVMLQTRSRALFWRVATPVEAAGSFGCAL